MKLTFVEIAGFRAFKDKTRFEFPAGFVVLTGRNGVGKSTVLDAIDFALTGTLSKYVVREAKGGGLHDHIWWMGDGVADANYVSVGFVDGSGNEFLVSRSREHGLKPGSEMAFKELFLSGATSNSISEAKLTTTLIRDEMIAAMSLDLPGQARFTAVREAIGGLTGPDYTPRLARIVDAAQKSQTEQKNRVSAVEADLGRALGSLTEAKSSVERQPDVMEARRILEVLEPDLLQNWPDIIEAIRERSIARKLTLARFADAVGSLERIHTERVYLDSVAGQDDLKGARQTHDAARKLLELNNANLTEALRAEETERKGDELAAHMLSLLEHGEAVGLQEGHCPLCAAFRTTADFQAAIASARTALTERGARISTASAYVKTAQAARDKSLQECAVAETRLASELKRRNTFDEELASVKTTFSQLGVEVLPQNPESARRELLKRQEDDARLERALYILSMSNAHDGVNTLQTRVKQLRDQLATDGAKLASGDRALDSARQIEKLAKSTANQLLTEQFDTVMPLLKEMYRRLRPHADWREIETDFGGSVRASLNFSVGNGQNPQFVFSSGQRRAAGLAFLLAIHLSRPWCQLHSLLLDDPVQHVDDYRALNLVEVLSTIRRTGRQVIVAVEDTALADALCRRLRSHPGDLGRYFELGTSTNGSAKISRQTDVYPFPREVLREAAVS